MEHTQQIMAVITGILLLVLVAPRVFRFNMARGTTLRNITIWLLIFVGLVWVYQFTHPAPTTAPAAAPVAEGSNDIPQNPDAPTTNF